MNPFEEKIESAEEYDLDQGSRIVNPPYITEKKALLMECPNIKNRDTHFSKRIHFFMPLIIRICKVRNLSPFS